MAAQDAQPLAAEDALDQIADIMRACTLAALPNDWYDIEAVVVATGRTT